ncbi:glycosyltransferase [Mucilaginibacter sp. UR6-11]|uniref:glycosyltransferase n=1 Tax=Mucilaginibacter sp. UR6-11 TaxID=1435644 RepID=UPI001E40BC93|nr:glycosyltransferase [Mucilaginibacter sp. UR6-11]MCC8423769.1 glycosyltransferase [Mucilaginibacter sp. UR6-11]
MENMNADHLLKNRDIVIVGQQSWDVEIGSNCKNIALEFSKNNRVLYVNSPLDRITRLKQKADPKVKKRIAVINGSLDGLIEIKQNLWNYYPDKLIESINWIKNEAIYNRLNKYNNRIFARTIKKAINRLGFKNIILFNDSDMFRSFYLKELLKPAVSVYYSRDYMLYVDYWKLHGEKLEPKLISKSDLCVANSTYLASYCRQHNKNSFYVGQGCDLEMFMNKQDTPVPADMIAIRKPVIGYVGALQSIRLDLALLEHIAKAKPEWSIVLVGPEDKEFTASNLHQIENIHFLGGKDPNSLAGYINSFDVCLNPQIVNQVTIGNYPRKIDEYLAMGKPVVATRTEAMSVFEQYVYLGKTREDYVMLIEKALTEDSEEKRRARVAFAATHSWENSVNDIYKAIMQVEEAPDRPAR